MAIDLSRYRVNALPVTAAIIAAAVAATAFVYYSPPATDLGGPPPPLAIRPTETITVHVSGAVVGPGLVEVAASSRVADVIAAAGGSAPGADLAALNLAAAVRDGEQVVVPGFGETGQVTTDGEGRVRLNTAAAGELEQIPGVGPVLAGRIIEARELVGGFTTIEDLLDVSGIGEAKLAALRDYVVVP